MASKLRRMRVKQIALVDSPASQADGGKFGAFVALFKGDGMTECKGCGAVNEKDAGKCVKCGASMKAATPPAKEPAMADDNKTLEKLQADLKAADELLTGEVTKRETFEKQAKADREALEKRVADQAAENEKLAKRLTAIEDERKTADWIQKAAELKHLPGKPEELGVMLKRSEAALPEEDFALLMKTLKAADAAAASGFTEVGRPGAGSQSGSAAEEVAREVQARIEKSAGKLTEGEATAQLFSEKPALYKRYRIEASTAGSASDAN